MRASDYHVLKILVVAIVAIFLRFFLADFVGSAFPIPLRWVAVVVVLVIGIGFIMRHVVDVIEATTDVLQERTGLAGGLLQSFGTALPDMIIGIVAALLSVEVRATDYARSVNLAVVAGAATFGSNIYNILYSVWCVSRQNLANRVDQKLSMIPFLPQLGLVTPVRRHHRKPIVKEFTTATSVLVALSVLTAVVAVSMVLFGHVAHLPNGFSGDLYQLIRPVGVVVAALCIGVLYVFRKNERREIASKTVRKEERYYEHRSNVRIWSDLAVSAAALYLAAEAMVAAIESLAGLTHMPYVVAGVAAGIIGCVGEMVVIHKFVVNPTGRVGDAIVGVAMDNILTTLGAALVALIGGIFLGGPALLVIFVLILMSNTVLIAQIVELKDSVAKR